MLQQLLPGLRMTLIFTVLTGVFYPLLVTGVCQALFPKQSNGSLITSNGTVIGSTLIGQNFTKPQYFQPRPSAAGTAGYDPTASGGSDYGPTNQNLYQRMKTAVDKFRKENPDYTGPIPSDLLTASGSGLDPEISPASAEAQAVRVAKARDMSLDDVKAQIEEHTKGRELGFMGEPRVNVLELNLALDGK